MVAQILPEKVVEDQALTYEQKMEFLLIVLEAEEKRRSSMENKSSILIASNAILVGAIISIGIPSINSSIDPISIIKTILFITALACLIISIYLCIKVLMPSGDKGAKKIMGWHKDAAMNQSLMYFGEISKLEVSELLERLDSLNEQKILEQIASRVHNLSRLLNHRYRILRMAHRVFVIAVVLFAFLAMVRLFTG